MRAASKIFNYELRKDAHTPFTFPWNSGNAGEVSRILDHRPHCSLIRVSRTMALRPEFLVLKYITINLIMTLQMTRCACLQILTTPACARQAIRHYILKDVMQPVNKIPGIIQRICFWSYPLSVKKQYWSFEPEMFLSSEQVINVETSLVFPTYFPKHENDISWLTLQRDQNI